MSPSPFVSSLRVLAVSPAPDATRLRVLVGNDEVVGRAGAARVEAALALVRAAVRAAVASQRDLHEREEEAARQTILAEGCTLTELAAAEHDAFAAAVKPLLDEAQTRFGGALFGLVKGGR